MSSAPIGLLDSGVGGLSILREVQRLLPHEHLIYVADQGNLPYGPRPLEQVQAFAEGITRWLLAQGAKAVVIPCNTASAAALYTLRSTFPDVPFVGMEPAVRPAARDTQTGVIGVIATAATFQGQLYASVVDRFASDVQVVTRACPEFVMLAERGGPWTDADKQLAGDLLADMREAGADQLVLGCTHFAFLKPLLDSAMGGQSTIVDPSPAVARQTQRLLEQRALLADDTQQGSTRYFTTGDTATFQRQITTLLEIETPPVKGLIWSDGHLHEAPPT